MGSGQVQIQFNIHNHSELTAACSRLPWSKSTARDAGEITGRLKCDVGSHPGWDSTGRFELIWAGIARYRHIR
jgi:hypothetical protein